MGRAHTMHVPYEEFMTPPFFYPLPQSPDMDGEAWAFSFFLRCLQQPFPGMRNWPLSPKSSGSSPVRRSRDQACLILPPPVHTRCGFRTEPAGALIKLLQKLSYGCRLPLAHSGERLWGGGRSPQELWWFPEWADNKGQSVISEKRVGANSLRDQGQGVGVPGF